MDTFVCACRGVTRLDGARGKNQSETTMIMFGTPMLEPEVFKSKFTVLEKVLVTLLGLFSVAHSDSAAHSDLATGELCSPWVPRYAPVC